MLQIETPITFMFTPRIYVFRIDCTLTSFQTNRITTSSPSYETKPLKVTELTQRVNNGFSSFFYMSIYCMRLEQLLMFKVTQCRRIFIPFTNNFTSYSISLNFPIYNLDRLTDQGQDKTKNDRNDGVCSMNQRDTESEHQKKKKIITSSIVMNRVSQNFG